MALAPGLNRKRGLFGASAQVPQQPAMTASAQPLAPAKPSFFGEGGVGRAIAGNIGDFLLQQSGMAPIYAPAMQERRAMAYGQQQREAQRRQGLEDWVWKEEYERRNPKPQNPTSFEQILDAAGIAGDERIGLLRRKAENDAAGVPVGIDVQNADGSVTRQYVRPGTLGGQPSSPPPAAIDALRGNPSLRDQFNQKYGPGAAERYLGGASGNAGGNF